MKPCPKCSSTMAKSVRKPLLLWLIPGSERFKCLNCKNYHTWFKPIGVGIQL